MPQSELSGARVASIVGRTPGADELERAFFASKAERTHVDGDAWTIEVTPDRLDLLSEGGLGLALQGILGLAHGRPPLVAPSAPRSVAIRADASVAPLRAEIGAIVVHAPPTSPMDAGLLAEAIRFQEILHATVGYDRRLASLGIYPLDRLRPPFAYRAEPMADVTFLPLDGNAPVTADAFFASHPLAVRYGTLGRSGTTCLTLRDAEARVLSLPPILNSRDAGEARIGDRTLLLESTGTRAARVEEALGLLLLVFAARGWSAEPVRIERSGSIDEGRAILAGRVLPLTAARLATVGGHAYSAPEIERWVGRARLGVRPAPHGFLVDVPPWRPDLLTEVDVIEDVVLARGVRSDDGLVLPSATRGRHRAESRFRSRVHDLLLGLGSSPLYTPVLSPRWAVERLGRSASVIALTNPVSEELAFVRDTLAIPLLGVLARNTRHGYPQRFHEVAAVVVRDPGAETGAATRYHAGLFLAHDTAGFADAAAQVDYLVRAFGAAGVREPHEIPGTIPGRAARLRIAGETVAEMGEIRPSILASLGVPVPVAWAEVDLTALWPLIRPEEMD
ncbi:MAG: hypothetical protein ACREDK_06905 [Thermoplasmata archaeon]